MKEAEIDEQFRLLQQAVVLAGEAVETLKRDQRRNCCAPPRRGSAEALFIPGSPRAGRAC